MISLPSTVYNSVESIDPLCDYEVIDNNLLSTAKEDTDQSLSFDYIGYGCLPSDGNLTEYTRLG